MENEEILKKAYEKIKYSIDENGCWNVTGGTYRDKSGYHKIIYKDKDGKRKWISAHRLSYIVNVGEIPSDRIICHNCDNNDCINPECLYLGTNKTNTQDMLIRKRYSDWSDRNGKREKLTEDEVLQIYSSNKSSYELADMYNIASNHARRIRNGSRCQNITKHNSKENVEKRRADRELKTEKQRLRKEGEELYRMFGAKKSKMLRYADKMIKANKWTEKDALDYFETGKTPEQERNRIKRLKYPGLSSSQRTKMQWLNQDVRDRTIKSMRETWAGKRMT